MQTFSFIMFDIFSIILSFSAIVIAYMLLELRLNYNNLFMIIPIIVLIKIVFYYALGLYKVMLVHFGFEDAVKLFVAIILTNMVLMVFFLFGNIVFISWLSFIFITPIEMFLLFLPRVARRVFNYYRITREWKTSLGRRTLIIGAGDGGEMVIKEIFRNRELINIPVAFVDDNPSKIGNNLLGIPIVGPTSRIKEFIDEYDIDEVIIAIANLSYKKLKDLADTIAEKDVNIKRLPLISEIKSGVSQQIVDVKVEDLLNRDEINLEFDDISKFIQGRTVLITGGGGSIGGELARQVADLAPKKLIIFDIYENNAYDIQMELERYFRKRRRHLNLSVLIGSVYNKERLEKVFKHDKIDIVFHAAAYKHVPLLEDSPEEAVRSNMMGTYITADLASRYKVKNFVLVSSDKAVRPTNIMGATKRYAELIIQHFNEQSDTKFSAVRFGNVLGSNGSVVPLFKKEIENGGPVSVTHPEVTRYFMTVSEAVGLIMQSAVYARGGEIFVLDMGEPVQITKLAEKMIRLAGYKPYTDIDIVFTGLRPGEKIFEELLVDKQKQIKTDNEKIFVENSSNNGKTKFEQEIFNKYLESFESKSPVKLKQALAKILMSYDCSGTCDVDEDVK